MKVNEATAIRHYAANLASNKRIRERRFAQGLCAVSGCDHPLATKHLCRYHADLASQTQMRYRRGESRPAAKSGELNVGAAVRRYTRQRLVQLEEYNKHVYSIDTNR